MRRFLLAGLLLSGMAVAVSGADRPKLKAESFEIPYRLTIPKHIMVRAKINNKGPFNFILDTGAPALFVATSVGKKLGLKPPDKNGWTTFERLEIEGGLVIENAKGIVQTPFQLEGMNGMGMAGVELHGMIGYNILARYRMQIDFTKDKMVWTPLDWTPALPMRAGGGKGGGAGGLEMMGSIMKGLGSFLGRKATPDYVLRPSLGLDLTEVAGADDVVRVRNVFAGGPAQKAGVRQGDRITAAKRAGSTRPGTVSNIADVESVLEKLKKGDKIDVIVERAGQKKTITIEPGEGL